MQARSHLSNLRRELALTRFRIRQAAFDPEVSTEEWGQLLVQEDLVSRRLQMALSQLQALKQAAKP